MTEFQPIADRLKASKATEFLKRATRKTEASLPVLPGGIIRQRRNAWQVGKVEKAAFLIDGAAYFLALDQALRKAVHTIWIVGWDFNPDIRLRPHQSSETLGELLLSLADEKPDLRIRILVWGMGPIYSGKSLRLFRESEFSAHPQISMLLEGRDLTRISDADMLAVRGGEIGMVFQNPTSHLDPVMRIGDQITEGIRYHQGLNAQDARAAAIEILTQVGFPDPTRQYDSYPHEFSGGMRQRAMIGVSLSCNPKILIADEPTTALDVTIQAQILRLLMYIRDKRGLSIILITHDLGIVAQTCDRIAVLRGGQLLEQGPKRAILTHPQHPYTVSLIASHPSMPDETAATSAETDRTGHAVQPLLEIDDLHVRFNAGGSLFKGASKTVSAVAGVSLRVMPGESLGIVGESGSGKSTLARAILGLTPLSSGHVTFDGIDLAQQRTAGLAQIRREAAMVFQDPFNALNPRMTIGQTLSEVLKVQGKIAPSAIPERVNELLDLVGLEREFAGRKPRSMSGGQCQRAGIARALAVDPKMIIADECVAALDVTIQAQIVELFQELKAKMQLTLLFIAHDLAIVRNLCERVVVMYRGEIVEEGRSADVFARPQHPYTAALIAAIPDIDPDKRLLGDASAADRENYFIPPQPKKHSR